MSEWCDKGGGEVFSHRLMALGDLDRAVVLSATILSIDRDNNQADIEHVTTVAEPAIYPDLITSAVPFFYHCEFSNGSDEDLAKGNNAFSVDDTVYLFHFPQTSSDLARTFIVGHADISDTRTCSEELLYICIGEASQTADEWADPADSYQRLSLGVWCTVVDVATGKTVVPKDENGDVLFTFPAKFSSNPTVYDWLYANITPSAQEALNYDWVRDYIHEDTEGYPWAYSYIRRFFTGDVPTWARFGATDDITLELCDNGSPGRTEHHNIVACDPAEPYSGAHPAYYRVTPLAPSDVDYQHKYNGVAQVLPTPASDTAGASEEVYRNWEKQFYSWSTDFSYGGMDQSFITKDHQGRIYSYGEESFAYALPSGEADATFQVHEEDDPGSQHLTRQNLMHGDYGYTFGGRCYRTEDGPMATPQIYNTEFSDILHHDYAAEYSFNSPVHGPIQPLTGNRLTRTASQDINHTGEIVCYQLDLYPLNNQYVMDIDTSEEVFTLQDDFLGKPILSSEVVAQSETGFYTLTMVIVGYNTRTLNYSAPLAPAGENLALAFNATVFNFGNCEIVCKSSFTSFASIGKPLEEVRISDLGTHKILDNSLNSRLQELAQLWIDEYLATIAIGSNAEYEDVFGKTNPYRFNVVPVKRI